MSVRQIVLVLSVIALLIAALTGCAGAGRVIDRATCKTSECIYVRQADGSVEFEMTSWGSYPSCSIGARWPECKEVS